MSAFSNIPKFNVTIDRLESEDNLISSVYIVSQLKIIE